MDLGKLFEFLLTINNIFVMLKPTNEYGPSYISWNMAEKSLPGTSNAGL